MPLIQGASKLACKANYGRLIADGYPKNQAFAIMVDICKRNMHKVSRERQREIEDRKFM